MSTENQEPPPPKSVPIDQRFVNNGFTQDILALRGQVQFLRWVLRSIVKELGLEVTQDLLEDKSEARIVRKDIEAVELKPGA